MLFGTCTSNSEQDQGECKRKHVNKLGGDGRVSRIGDSTTLPIPRPMTRHIYTKSLAALGVNDCLGYLNCTHGTHKSTVCEVHVREGLFVICIGFPDLRVKLNVRQRTH